MVFRIRASLYIASSEYLDHLEPYTGTKPQVCNFIIIKIQLDENKFIKCKYIIYFFYVACNVAFLAIKLVKNIIVNFLYNMQ